MRPWTEEVGILKIKDLKAPISNAKKILQSMKSDYPHLQVKLVLQSFAKNTEVDATPWQLLKETPAIFAANHLRDELLLLADIHEKLKSRNDAIKSGFVSGLIVALTNRIDLILSQIDVTETASIDLQFINLDYELISELQNDPRVDPMLTPRTKASIRISLGTIRNLLEVKGLNKIAIKNDLCRRTFSGCQVLMTMGVAHHEDRHLILKAVKEFNIFDKSNDPYGEHDFGSFSLNGQVYFWKFDYYDDDFKYFKENGNRVLTIGKMDEY